MMQTPKSSTTPPSTVKFAWSSGHSLLTLVDAAARLSAIDLRMRGQAGPADDGSAGVADAIARLAGVHARWQQTWADVDALATALARTPGVVLEHDGDGVTVFHGVIVVDRARVAHAAAFSDVGEGDAPVEADVAVARVFDALEELVMLVASVPEGVVELTLDGRAAEGVKDGPALGALRALFAGVDDGDGDAARAEDPHAVGIPVDGDEP